jgi:hypothetical protein
MTTAEMNAVAPAASGPGMSPVARMIAVFTRPAQAWDGLPRQVQWWFPVVVTLLVTSAGNLLIHDRALVPMLFEQWEEAVADGAMTAEQLQSMQGFFDSPAGKIMVVVQQAVILPLFTLLAALLVWFGVGFVLGSRISYRLALEVAAWSGLITLPGYLITITISWFRETMRGVHVGFGILLPEQDSPTRLMTALGVILDGIGPLSLWYLAVAVIGASTLSGAPRQRVWWVLGGLYLVILVISAVLASMQVRA